MAEGNANGKGAASAKNRKVGRGCPDHAVPKLAKMEISKKNSAITCAAHGGAVALVHRVAHSLAVRSGTSTWLPCADARSRRLTSSTRITPTSCSFSSNDAKSWAISCTVTTPSWLLRTRDDGEIMCMQAGSIRLWNLPTLCGRWLCPGYHAPREPSTDKMHETRGVMGGWLYRLHSRVHFIDEMAGHFVRKSIQKILG